MFNCTSSICNGCMCCDLQIEKELFSVKTVSVKFINGYASGIYDFKTNLNLTEGDVVVCDTSRGYQVAEVVAVNNIASRKATKWVIDVVNINRHKARLAAEAEAKKIKTELDKRVKRFQESELLKIIAGRDKDVAILVAEYHALTGCDLCE